MDKFESKTIFRYMIRTNYGYYVYRSCTHQNDCKWSVSVYVQTKQASISYNKICDHFTDSNNNNNNNN
jgi:hypothetical protein